MSPHEGIAPVRTKAERWAGATLMTLSLVLPRSWLRQREGMVENRPALTVLRHLILIVGIAIVAFPIYVTFVASSLTAEQVLNAPMSLLPGTHLIDNYTAVLTHGAGEASAPVGQMMINSLITALIIVFGKITISILSAFAIVYFRFPLRMLFFWMIFVTLMLPVEVRILPTYKVVADLGMINTYAGLTVPLIASATATFLFLSLIHI